MEGGNFNSLVCPEHLMNNVFWLIEQTRWGRRGRGTSQSSREDFEEPPRLAQTLCLTKQTLLQPWCPQRCLNCEPILTRWSAGKRII